MAPRQRSHSVGNTRMHAAVDALTPMGFSPNIIRKNVKYLLDEVYGGAEGWPFIEAESYRVLIERILEVQEEDTCEPVPELPSLSPSQTKITPTQDSSSHHEPQNHIPTALEACELPSLPPPQTQITPTQDSFSHPEPQEHFPVALEACELPSLPPPPPQIPNIPTQDFSFPENPTENPIQDVQLQISSTFDAHELPYLPPPPQTEYIPTRNPSLSENPSRNQTQEMKAQIAQLLVTCENSAPPGFERKQKSVTTKPKRRRCLGWIGPEDDNDFVLLREPIPFEGQQERRWAPS